MNTTSTSIFLKSIWWSHACPFIKPGDTNSPQDLLGCSQHGPPPGVTYDRWRAESVPTETVAVVFRTSPKGWPSILLHSTYISTHWRWAAYTAFLFEIDLFFSVGVSKHFFHWKKPNIFFLFTTYFSVKKTCHVDDVCFWKPEDNYCI